MPNRFHDSRRNICGNFLGGHSLWSLVPRPILQLLEKPSTRSRFLHVVEVGNILRMVLRIVLGVFALELVSILTGPRCFRIPLYLEVCVSISSLHQRCASNFVNMQFNAARSPPSQARHRAITAHLSAAIIGSWFAKTSVIKLILRLSQWSAGALACAIAASVMSLTTGLHPPAGATALLAVVDQSQVALGWKSLPFTVLGCILVHGTDFLLRKMEELPLLKKNAENCRIVVVRPGNVSVPERFCLSEKEEMLLQRLSSRLQ